MFNNLRLSTKLNISFILALFIPMIVAMVFSIAYFTEKIKTEAVTKIKSDVRVTELLFQNSLKEIRQLAESYGRQKYLVTLFKLDLGYKIGIQLAKDGEADNLNLITVFDTEGKIIARSHNPGKIGEIIDIDQLMTKALAGESGSSSELIPEAVLTKEGIKNDVYLKESQKIFSITGWSPVYDNDRKNIMGGVIIRRLQYHDSVLIKRIRNVLNVKIALFEGVRMNLSQVPDGDDLGVHIPPAAFLESVYAANDISMYEDFRKNGHLSMLLPISGFDNKPLGLIMIQRNVNDYIKTRNNAVTILLIIFFIGFILTIVIKTIVVRQIINPISRLKKGTTQIRRGDYSYHIEADSRDEIGELTHDFNKMASALHKYDKQLKAYNKELEQRVQERTKELRVANEALVKSNRDLEDTLEKLNPGVSGLIKSNSQQLGLVYATELVCDVCNYTKLNMILGETLIGNFMKRFFRESHRLLAMYRGMFDKTVGDQIVAIFGTAKDHSPEHINHPFDAVECALQLIHVSKSINKELKKAIEENYTAISERYHSLSSEDRKSVSIDDLAFNVRIGINTSNPQSDREIDRMRMVMMGAETCVDYTAQGGSVIYAFRLESSGSPGEIHIGENTKRVVEHLYTFNEVPSITLKGLGIQPCYKIIGKRPLFENIFPKTHFYKDYVAVTNGLIENLIETLIVGEVHLYEVRKISDPILVGVSYTEYISGFHKRALSRAHFFNALANHVGIEEDRRHSGVWACVWENMMNLLEFLPDSFTFRDPLAAESFNINKEIVETLIEDASNTEWNFIETAMISFVNDFDGLVFDRTFFKSNKDNMLSPREAIVVLESKARYDDTIITAAKHLFITDEAEIADERADDKTFDIPKDINSIASLLKQEFSKDDIKQLLDIIKIEE